MIKFTKIQTIMKNLKLSEFSENVEFYFDKVSNSSQTITVETDEDNEIVIMSLKEYNSLMATNYELSSRANELRLDSAIENMKSGRSFSKELIEE